MVLAARWELEGPGLYPKSSGQLAGALGGLACVSQIHLCCLLSTRGCVGQGLVGASELENKARSHYPRGT